MIVAEDLLGARMVIDITRNKSQGKVTWPLLWKNLLVRQRTLQDSRDTSSQVAGAGAS